MAKFYGEIGFFNTVETVPGVWSQEIVTRNYYGDIIKNTRRLQSTENLNDNIVVSDEISIVADPFANENFHHMIYVVYMGAKWKISSVKVDYPRLILSIGEVYNDDNGAE